MGFLVKSLLAILFIAVGGGFVINKVPSWKQGVIEVINPAAKEARLLGELKVNLDELDSAINSGGNVSRGKNLITKSRGLVDEITAVNQKNSGIIKQQVGKIIDALIDRTPYPADHLQTVSPTHITCPVK
ncbi:MAG: hypothetical protein HY454_02450 [Parcubacteria group bacterium]|nr:hypothetical protein [Parcubacteria group bacterium]